MINGNSVTSFATTVAVNCNPVDAPTTTVPAGRPQGMSRTGAPASDSAVAAIAPATTLLLTRGDVELNAAGRHLAFVELRSRLQDLVQRYGLFETLDRDHFYDSIDESLAEIDAAADDPRP